MSSCLSIALGINGRVWAAGGCSGADERGGWEGPGTGHGCSESDGKAPLQPKTLGVCGTPVQADLGKGRGKEGRRRVAGVPLV